MELRIYLVLMLFSAAFSLREDVACPSKDGRLDPWACTPAGEAPFDCASEPTLERIRDAITIPAEEDDSIEGFAVLSGMMMAGEMHDRSKTATLEECVALCTEECVAFMFNVHNGACSLLGTVQVVDFYVPIVTGGVRRGTSTLQTAIEASSYSLEEVYRAWDDCRSLRAQCMNESSPLHGRWQLLVSLTTLPRRLEHVHHMVATLKDQILQPRKVVLSVPQTSKRLGGMPYSIPEELAQDKYLTIIRTEDWGPATKLIGALGHTSCPNDLIITVDDDQGYTPLVLLNLLLHSIDHPNAIIAHVGYNLKGAPAPNFEYKRRVQTLHAVQMIGGYMGVLYKRAFLSYDLLTAELGEDSSMPPAVWFVDDDFLSAMSALHGVPRLVVPEPLFGVSYSLVGRSGGKISRDGLNGQYREEQIARQEAAIQFFIEENVLDAGGNPSMSMPWTCHALKTEL